MSTPSSWRDLLGNVISDPAERERLAAAIGVNAVTLSRWAQGVSAAPRPQKLQQLVRAFPASRQALLTELLQREYGQFQEFETADRPEKIDYAFIQQIWEVRATTHTHLQFWTLSDKIFESALRQLDPQQMGMSITLAQLMPPSPHGSIRSLREVAGLGSWPWSPNLEHQLLFLGAETLAGYVVSHSRVGIINDLRDRGTLLPISQREHVVSAAACPIMHANRVAGCLLFSSTQPAHFQSDGRRSLINDYTQLLALVFLPDQFFEQSQIQLWLMPPPEIQYRTFATFHQRVNRLMKEAYAVSQLLTRPQAEEQIWRQIEEELLCLSHQQD
jgi:transcriptional regulator with XRE-family HTH domain